MKALLATPLYDGTAQREFVQGLLQCQGLYYGGNSARFIIFFQPAFTKTSSCRKIFTSANSPSRRVMQFTSLRKFNCGTLAEPSTKAGPSERRIYIQGTMRGAS